MGKNLLQKIYGVLGPDIEADDLAKTYSIIKEGTFFNTITEAYYTFKRYKKINK